MNTISAHPSSTFEARGGAVMRFKRWVLFFALLAWQLVATAQNFPAGACSPVPNSKSCVDSTPCKSDSNGNLICLAGSPAPAGSYVIAKTCWQYAYQYACSNGIQDNCTPYANNPACGVVASSCQDHAEPSGACDSWLFTYKCQTAAAVTSQQLVCSNGLFDNSLYPTPTVANQTFNKAAIASELLRESQVYSADGRDIFSGVKETCSKGYGGLKNCCKTSPGAKSNSQMSTLALGAGASVAKYYGAKAVDWASSYVFDAMYNNGLWTDAMTSAFETGADSFGTSLAASDFSLGAYGLSYSTTVVSTTGATGTGLFGADTALVSFGPNGTLMFNPYTFVIAVVIAIVMSLTSCTQEEQMLAMHKGASLSVYERTDCTSSVLGSCVEHTDTYCSFNSVLSKIVNVGGKAQLGLDPQDCTGFTTDQLSRLDFSKIDFSEFAASIATQATNNLPTSTAIQQSYSPLLQSITGGSAQTGSMATGSSVVGGTTSPAPPPNAALPTYPPKP